jgi:hypothetical protein
MPVVSDLDFRTRDKTLREVNHVVCPVVQSLLMRPS